MNRQSFNRQFPAGNPLANAIVIIVGALIIGAAIILGVFALVALGAIMLVLAAVLGIRLWWHGRKSAKYRRKEVRQEEIRSSGKSIIEGEYRVVSEHHDEHRPD